MAELADESSSADDPEYWTNIFEELLDIDSQKSHRKSSTVSIVLHTDEDPQESGTTDTAAEPDGELSINNLDRNLLTAEHIYVFDDGDSEVLGSECDLFEGDLEDQGLERQKRLSEYSEEFDALYQTRCIGDEYTHHTTVMCELITTRNMPAIDAYIEEHAEDIGAICLVSDDSGTTAVTAAASLGCLEVLQKLSDAGVWLYCYDGDGYMAIHRAAENGHSDVVDWLAGQGQWTASTKDDLTAIHVAARCGQYQVVNTLLNYVTSLDLEAGGMSPLQLAIQNGHARVAELLIGRGAEINRVNEEGKTALHVAAEAGEVGIVDLLLTYDAEVNSQVFKSGKTPLHLAVENNRDQVVCKLLDNGAGVDIPDCNQETVLHKLHFSGLPTDCVGYLCRQSDDIDQKTRKGRSALFVAVEHGNIYVSGILIEHGANPNFEVTTGCTPLYAATHHGHWEIVEKLLLAGANANKQTDNGSTALYKACRNGLYHIVALLLCSGAKVDLARKTGWAPLHVAIHHGNTKIVEQLLASGANVNALDNQGQTPMAIAAYCKNPAIVKLLKKCCDDPVSVYKVAKLGNGEVLKYLATCQVNLEVRNAVCGWRPIHHAAVEGNNRAITALVAAKVDINSQDSDGFTPLHLAILHKRTQAVELLLNHCCHTCIPSKSGDTCMALAVKRGYASILQILLRHGVSMDEPDGDGKRPLEVAIEQKHKAIARLLVAHGATVNAYDDDVSAIAPVRMVCQHGDAELLKIMANRGARIEQRDAEYNTLLHTAAYYGNQNIVLELVTMRGSLIHAKNAHGKLALHLAAVQGHALVVEALLSAGTKVSIMDSDETVNYDMAKHKEVWEVLKRWANVRPAMLVPPPARLTPSAPVGEIYV